MLEGIEEEMNVSQEEEEKVEMSPCYLFLASSLNVELVYIILKSISQFSTNEKDKTRIS